MFFTEKIYETITDCRIKSAKFANRKQEAYRHMTRIYNGLCIKICLLNTLPGYDKDVCKPLDVRDKK